MGRFEIRKFTIQALLPKLSKSMPDTFVTLIVTFGFAQNERKNYFFVQVIYQPRPSFKQTSELHWTRLPVSLECMVYFLRKYLKVEFDQQKNLQYASIANYPGRTQFDFEMNALRKKLDFEGKQSQIIESVLKQRIEDKRADMEAEAIDEYEVVANDIVYVVKVIESPEQLRRA